MNRGEMNRDRQLQAVDDQEDAQLRIPIDDEDLWTAKEVAKYLKTSRSWVYEQTDKGEIPYCKLVGNKRFVPSDIRAYVARNKIKPNGDE